MQLQNVLHPVQMKAARLFKGFFEANPELTKKYVNTSLAVLHRILSPVDTFMRHLLVVQGLDPDTTPGAKQREALQLMTNELFNKTHDKDFDDDYDFTWIQKRFEDTKKTLNQPQLTKEKFMDLTDISRFNDKRNLEMEQSAHSLLTTEILQSTEVNQIAPESVKKETPLDTPEGRQAYRAEVASKFEQERENTKQEIASLDALETFKKALNELDDLIQKDKKLQKKQLKKSGVKAGKKKLNKATSSKKKDKGTRVNRVPVPVEEGSSTLTLESDHKIIEPSTRGPGRNLKNIVQSRKAQDKAAKESTPEFQAELKTKMARVTRLTDLMVEKGLCDDRSRQDRISSMIAINDDSLDSLERMIIKYAPTKDAIAENKFKGSFKRVK